MKIFSCPNCCTSLFFENTQCEKCHTLLIYNPITKKFEDLKKNARVCKNYQLDICNWLIDENSNSDLCTACSLNREVPNSSNLENFKKWKNLEAAKHRLIYQLLNLELPLISQLEDENGIAFDFLSDKNKYNAVTGHANGVVTILLSEADSVHREQLRKKMEEPYRTLLGHFRHEIGHYYWELLFDEHNINEFRGIFGDERISYAESLKKHYKNGAPKNWNHNFISEYASSHPWEDWAETWAHYLHMMDTLETAHSFDVSFQQKFNALGKQVTYQCPDPYATKKINKIFEASVSLTCMANSLNRSMGLPDIYPFVIPQAVYHKLKFIHNLLASYRKN
ncbi:zinc-binding metallopeptidase family protein [Wenyingzhuangia sp. IMCC45533]